MDLWWRLNCPLPFARGTSNSPRWYFTTKQSAKQLVIIDARDRPEIVHLIELHDKLPPGDVLSAWGNVNDDPDNVSLILHFVRPVEASMFIPFNIANNGTVVELALKSRAIYLQAGKPGDRFINSVEVPRVLVEIGGEMPAETWRKLWDKALRKKFRALGLSRAAAKLASAEFIDEFKATIGSGLNGLR